MKRVWHTVVRALLIGGVLFPMWLAYVIPFLRMRRFGATIPARVWERKHRRYAKRFYWLAVKLRGGLIKVGQIMSTRVDLLPVIWLEELAGLQDEVTPMPWPGIEKRLVEEYGGALEDRFESLEHDAVAAASFGQVHRGVTLDGDDVAVKIKYPDVEMKLAVDMWLFSIATRLFNVFLPKISLRPIYIEVSRALTTELDYEQEARFTRIIHGNFEGREAASIPRVHDDLTTHNVICTSWFEGKNITHPSVLEHPRMDRRVLLEKLLRTWIDMMYVDGVFQSDPHPGNLLARVGDDGVELCVVDFGQVKILDQAFHQKLVASVMAFSMGNVSMFMGSLVGLGLFEPSDVETLEPLVGGLMERLRDARPIDGQEIDFDRIRGEVLSTLDQMDGVVIPQELVLYGRTFSILAGVTRAIAPDVNAIAIARPLLTQALLAGGPPADPTQA